MKILILILIFALTTLAKAQLVTYDINTQSVCTEVERSSRGDCRWVAGLNALADQVIESGRIIGYQILWSNGNWSHWYIPGVNDLDIKYNPSPKTCAFSYRANTMRRMWSYFTDHRHKFIICKFQ